MMKFKDLKIGDKFIIPITPHIEKTEDDVDVMCYMRLYKKLDDNIAMIYKREVYGYYMNRFSIVATDVQRVISQDENVIVITKEDY